MKGIKTLLAIATIALAGFGCSTPAYVQQDESANLANYKTYMWVNTSAGETDVSKRATEYADISMRNAVNAELKSWGWREVTENPDALVSYDILVERNVESQTQPVHTQPFTRSYYNPYTRRWSTIYYPSQFQGYQVYDQPVRSGTVTLTIIDPQKDKNIWQGWTTERLSSSRLTDADIRRSVRNIFKEAS